MTGTNFSSWYRQDEGTVLCNFDVAAPSVADGYGRVWQIDDNSLSNYFGLIKFNGANSSYATSIVVNGVNVEILSDNNIPANIRNYLAAGYKLNDFAQSYNGQTVKTDTSLTIPTVNKFNLGSFGGANQLNGHIAKLAYYPKRLTNAELQSITTV